MAEDDAELPRSAPEEQPSTDPAPRGRRQRAADLFSPHRYRELQLKAFERRAARFGFDDPDPLADDDVFDPQLNSDAPAAEAARAPTPHGERHSSLPMLSPVDAADDADDESFPFPYDENGDFDEDGDEDEAGIEPYVEGDAADDAGIGDAKDSVASDIASDVDREVVQEESDGNAAPLEEPRPKPGRDMRAAAVVGLLLLAATVGASYIHPIAFAALLYTFSVGAVIEWKRALERHGRRIPMVPLVAATVGLGVATYYGNAEGLVVALLVGCAGVVAWRIGDERIENTLADSLAGVLTLLWIPFLASFLFMLELADDGWQRVIIVVLAVVGNDTGALAAGVRFGRHKLLPRVSPAKTWEGAIGGLVVGTVAASVAAFFFFDGAWYIGTAVGAACAVAAAIGDLAESALKRDIQVKDMSTALPGHGGILDRIDSLLFAAPVGYVVFAMFLGTLGGGGL